MAVQNKTKGMSKQDFLDKVKEYNPNANLERISKAYDFAKQRHEGQLRASGENHFSHVSEVAYLLARLRLDSDTIAAALLHDVIEDTKVSAEQIEQQFGKDIRNLVVGVTKIKPLDVRKAEKTKMESLRKVILATSKDVRVILIKLVDRLHNMRTLKYLDSQKQQLIATETMNIYAPIAYKLGMYRIKSELEDLSLRYLEPQIYAELKARISKTKVERAKEVRDIISQIEKILAQKGIEAVVTGRAKSFYSIFKKMKKKNLNFDDIRDLYAIRVIVNSVDKCYQALGIIHSEFTPLPKMFDDYIATPKPNMYQSVHTEIIFKGKPVEVQFRTWEMHHAAEDGIAAHWRYHDTPRDKEFDKKINWLKQILDWKRSSKDAEEFIESLKVDLFKDEIVVFTPKGDPIPLAETSTPVDFAYMVHTEIGNHCHGAKVNGEIRPLDTELKSGDIVEILMSRKRTASRSWLNFVKTNQAKQKIRSALQMTKENEKQIATKDVEPAENLLSRIDSKGFKKSQFKVSHCCRISFGSEIAGFHMKDGKIAVHSIACASLRLLDDRKKVRLDWEKDSKRFVVKMRLEILDRVGLLSDILNILARNKINVETINQKMVKGKLVIVFELMPKGENKDIDLIKKQIGAVKNVLSVS